jgi:hypothetical protein
VDRSGNCCWWRVCADACALVGLFYLWRFLYGIPLTSCYSLFGCSLPGRLLFPVNQFSVL